MRRWARGAPAAQATTEPATVLGRPCQSWLRLFVLTHRATADGWQRDAWPDGGPLLAQPWPQVAALHTIADELARVESEQRRRDHARRQRS